MKREPLIEMFLLHSLMQMLPPPGPDVHSHKCPSCSHVWTHDRAEIHASEDPDANEKAHTCPSCGCHNDLCWSRHRQ